MGKAAETEKAVVPLKTRIAIAVISTLSDAVRRKDGTINRRLLGLVDFKSSPSPSKPIRSVISSDTVVDTKRNLWFRVYTPTGEDAASLPVMIFFHGGGFCFLSAATPAYNLVCLRFARRLPAVVVSVEYRLSPEHRFPCQYDDGFDILRYLDDHHAQILPPNADLSRCFLAGDSAGANLAHHLAVRAGRSQFSTVKYLEATGAGMCFCPKDRIGTIMP
ncbi:alpha/beta-Hydrolases superfamily protein [Euphorbia peplus]|nr:alpha/beta-Hydrolases superfamily protein [Euphorbia peplus]